MRRAQTGARKTRGIMRGIMRPQSRYAAAHSRCPVYRGDAGAVPVERQRFRSTAIDLSVEGQRFRSTGIDLPLLSCPRTAGSSPPQTCPAPSNACPRVSVTSQSARQTPGASGRTACLSGGRAAGLAPAQASLPPGTAHLDSPGRPEWLSAANGAPRRRRASCGPCRQRRRRAQHALGIRMRTEGLACRRVMSRRLRAPGQCRVSLARSVQQHGSGQDQLELTWGKHSPTYFPSQGSLTKGLLGRKATLTRSGKEPENDSCR